jgi:2-keto-3-deoxy-L-rhamnonate aldolase RhmA
MPFGRCLSKTWRFWFAMPDPPCSDNFYNYRIGAANRSISGPMTPAPHRRRIAVRPKGEAIMEPVLRNAARDRLDAGELALGVGIRQSRTVDIAPIMKACGYDWLFLDLEHNSMDLDTAVQISVAALGVGIAPIARVPAGQHWLATRILDGGGLGIVMPHVDTVEEAREIADHLRYPPRGHRSIAGGLPHFGYAPVGTAAATAAIDAATLVVVMLETPRAIENAAAIAAVPGIDALLIGTSDLSIELGIPGRFEDQRIVNAYRTVVDACRAHGKFAGIGGIYEDALLRRYIGMGVRLVIGGGDLGFMQAAASARASQLRGCL